MNSATATNAQIIANLFSNDGTCFAHNGLDIETECRRHDSRPETDGFGSLRFDFADESSIVICGDGWDFGVKGCSAYCWEGGGCDC